MKGKTLFGFVVFGAAAALVASPALAVDGNGWYIGGGTGTTSVDVAVADFDDGGSLTAGDVDDGGVGFKLFGGYKFAKHFAVEGGYADLDEVAFAGTSDGTGAFWASGAVSSSVTVDGMFVTALGILPVAEKVSVFGKAGLMNWNADMTLTDTSGSLTASDDGSDPLFGVGVEIIPMEQFHIRAEYEQFSDVFDEDVNRVAGSLVYRF